MQMWCYRSSWPVCGSSGCKFSPRSLLTVNVVCWLRVSALPTSSLVQTILISWAYALLQNVNSQDQDGSYEANLPLYYSEMSNLLYVSLQCHGELRQSLLSLVLVFVTCLHRAQSQLCELQSQSFFPVWHKELSNKHIFKVTRNDHHHLI